MTEKQKEDNDKWSGTITLENNDIVYTSQNVELKRISLSSIKVIGEMTIQADAMANDWFFVFVDNDNEQHYIPAYANDMQDFLEQLGNKLNSKLVGTLFSSVTFASNIIYPNELAGQALLTFSDATSKNIWEKIEKILGLGKPITAELAIAVKEYKIVS